MDGSAIGLEFRRHFKYRVDAAILPELFFTLFVEEIMFARATQCLCAYGRSGDGSRTARVHPLSWERGKVKATTRRL